MPRLDQQGRAVRGAVPNRSPPARRSPSAKCVAICGALGQPYEKVSGTSDRDYYMSARREE